MEYLKHNFKSKETLTAQAMNEIDEGVASCVNPNQEITEISPIYNSSTKKTTSTIVIDPEDIHGKTFYTACGVGDTIIIDWSRFERELKKPKAGTKFKVIVRASLYMSELTKGQPFAELQGFDFHSICFETPEGEDYLGFIIAESFLDPKQVFQTDGNFGEHFFKLYFPGTGVFYDDDIFIWFTFEFITEDQCVVTPHVRHSHII